MLSSTLLFILVFLAGAPRRTPEHVLSASSLPTPLGHRSPIPEYAFPGFSVTPALLVGELTTVPANPWDVRLARLRCSAILFGTVQHSACVERAGTTPRSNGDRLSTRRKVFDLLDAQFAHRSASATFEVDVLGALLWILRVSVLSAVALSLFIHTVCQPLSSLSHPANTRQSPTKVLSWITKTWLGTPALQDEVAHLLRIIARNREAIAQTEFDIVSLQAETMLKENEHTQKKITTALLEGAKQDLLVRCFVHIESSADDMHRSRPTRLRRNWPSQTNSARSSSRKPRRSSSTSSKQLPDTRKLSSRLVRSTPTCRVRSTRTTGTPNKRPRKLHTASANGVSRLHNCTSSSRVSR